MESDWAFTQAQYHGVATRFDTLRDSYFAFAGQQFYCAHFAQIHTNWVVGAFTCTSLLDRARQRARVIFGNIVDGLDFFLSIVLIIVAGFVILDDLHAHVVNCGHDVFDLFGRHLILRQGRIQFIVGKETPALSLGEQFFDRRIIQVNQRRIAVFADIFFVFICATCQNNSPILLQTIRITPKKFDDTIVKCLFFVSQPLLLSKSFFSHFQTR